MTAGVSYMGTKRHLAQNVAELVHNSKQGPFLDLFSGMCSIGRAVGSSRQVWSNDLQTFAHLVSTTQFCSRDYPLDFMVAADIAHPYFQQNMAQCKTHYSKVWQQDDYVISGESIQAAAALFDSCVVRANSLLEGVVDDLEYSVFISRYGGCYFGVRQAAEIDSIRFAVDALKQDNLITTGQVQWMILALCVAMSKCANTTGHFAQALYPKKSNIKKVLSQRTRSVWMEWLQSLKSLQPSGSKDWRRKNHAFKQDAVSLLTAFKSKSLRPSVIYADPPYTNDQYSRFYHLYETLVLYDRPACSGKGLYRGNRATSKFSLSSGISKEIETLIAGVADIGSTFIMSYPTNGLLVNSEDQIPQLIKRYFGKAPEMYKFNHRHSTMGASKGVRHHDVIEIIYKVAA
jgi:adenine-specific DNA-methyltransferase